MSYLSRLKDEKQPGGEPSKGAKGAFDPFAGDPSGPFPGLPGDLVTGLLRLQGMRAPRLKQPDVWPELVADALRLGHGGWARQALALGWEPLQLFGCSPAAGGIVDLEGLAVWLAGRRVVVLDDRSCVVVNGPCSRAVFHRRSMDGAAFLWELGRGRSGN